MLPSLPLSLSKRGPAMCRGTSLERRNRKRRRGTAHSPKEGDKLPASFFRENNSCDHINYIHTLLRLSRRIAPDEQSWTNNKLLAGWQKVSTASWRKGWIHVTQVRIALPYKHLIPSRKGYREITFTYLPSVTERHLFNLHPEDPQSRS
jgi:hypothetical protein